MAWDFDQYIISNNEIKFCNTLVTLSCYSKNGLLLWKISVASPFSFSNLTLSFWMGTFLLSLSSSSGPPFSSRSVKSIKGEERKNCIAISRRQYSVIDGRTPKGCIRRKQIMIRYCTFVDYLLVPHIRQLYKGWMISLLFVIRILQLFLAWFLHRTFIRTFW